MPCRPSVSTRSTEPPPAARARARAAATVVLPVPPLPVTTCRRTEEDGTEDGAGLTRTSLGAPPVDRLPVAGRPPGAGAGRALPGLRYRPTHDRSCPPQVGVRHHPAADPQHQGDPRLLGRRRVGAGDGPARP